MVICYAVDCIKFVGLLGERQAVLAPPETEWYHGRLDRYTAEERLWKAANLGSYLGKSLRYSNILGVPL